MTHKITLGTRPVGDGAPVFLIAEAGVNHNGDISLAKQLIDVAVDAGADAVKFQTFNAAELATTSAPKAPYQAARTPVDESQQEMLRRFEFSIDEYRCLKAYCQDRIEFLSTPFDIGSVDLLDSLGVHAFKLPSGEIINLPLLAHVGAKRKPCLMSTGMATLGEVETALLTLANHGNPPVILLHCTSSYPADPADANLRAIETLRSAFQVPVGYSDHTPGIEVSVAAVALGAVVIEKHLTLDRKLEGPDHSMSLEPNEWRELVRAIRSTELALGRPQKKRCPSEEITAKIARKSLVARLDIEIGTRIESRHIHFSRPGTGLPPAAAPYIVGRSSRVYIPKGTVLELGQFS